MSTHSKRNLGAMEAQKDNNFENHFIEVQHLEKIIDNDSDIIYGLKGSGKTSLCRALTEINKDIFFATKFINLDSISFSQIHSALEALKNTTNKEVVNLASKTWHNVLLIYGIETYAETLNDGNKLKNKITDFVKNKKYTNTKSNNRIHTFLQNLILKIKDLGFINSEESPLGLTSRQFEEIDKTFDDELYELILESRKELSKQDKKILLCLDGFDSIIDHTEESRKAIFSGLVDAIYKCSKDNFVSDNFCFKAFLPRELTEDVRIVHFDADKFIFNAHYLNWAKPEFEELIVKRLTPYSRTKSKNFVDIWNEHFPEKIYNSVHSTEEYTIDYILRHTLYRPRHLLIHLQYILDEWDSKFASQKIHPSSIPKIVCQTNAKLSELISAELEYAINGVTQFLHSFKSVSCTTEFSFFTSRMRKMFGIETRENERKLFDKLYNIGIIGYCKKEDLAKKKSNSMGCSFAYSSSLNNRQVFNSLDDEDIVVLSPIFQEYCGCDYSNYGIIYQK